MRIPLGIVVSNTKASSRGWDKSLTLNIKSEQIELSDTQNSILFVFLSNLSILKFYNKVFLTSKSFCLSLHDFRL